MGIRISKIAGVALMCSIFSCLCLPMHGQEKDNLKYYKDKIEELKSSNVVLGASNRKLWVKVDSLEKDNENLRAQISCLEPIKLELVSKLQEEETPYLDTLYSAVDLQHINDVVSRCKMLKDARLDSLATNFQQLRERKEKYDSLVMILNDPYDEIKVDRGIVKADSLKVCSSSNPQIKEIDELRNCLELYKTATKTLPKIISRITFFMKSFRETPDSDEESARRAVEEFLRKDKAQQFNYNKYIAPIPCLVRTFSTFEKELLSNPFEKTTLEKELNP